MMIELKCPFCSKSLSADMEEESEVTCPVCFNKFTVTADLIVDSSLHVTDNDRLLDPSDPAGYFSNFPPEDDGM